MLAFRRDVASANGPICEVCDIRSLAVCGTLTPAQLPRLEAIATERHLASGQVLFYEGDQATEVFNVTQGMLKLYKLLSDGRRQITGFMLPGDFLGLAFAGPNGFTAEAVEPTKVCRFARSQFLRLLEELPVMEKALLGRASTELDAAQQQMLLLGRKTARERVASFLADLCRRQGIRERASLPLPMGRADIADCIGLTLETVSRTLGRLRDDRIIELPDAHVAVITDWRRLQQATGG